MQAASQIPDTRPPRHMPERFEYASGARPLPGYTIKRGIGAGGFGEVYYATSDGGKDVALKLIRRNLDVELRGVRQCLNVKHPHLLALFDVRQDEQGNSWVIMEYVSGECLEDVIARHPQGLPPGLALEWFRGVAAAVAHLHEHGIVHRDLKPGNIFCDQGQIKLGDYGLSKFISVSRRSGQTESIGTVHYMAPEIAKGCYGKEIDIYALGVLLYELLTGHVPFEGESVGEVLMKHLTAQPDLGLLAEPYRGTVAACLAKDPAERPRSVGELLARLVAATQSTAAQAGAQQAAPAISSKPVMPPQAGPEPRVGVAAAKSAWSRFWQSLSVPSKVLVTLAGAYASLSLFAAFAWFQFVPPSWTRGLLLAAIGVGIYWYLRSNKNAKAAIRQRPAQDLAPRGINAAAKVALLPAAESTRERVAELLGSLVFAAVVAAAVMVLAAAVRGVHLSAQQIAWQWLVGAMGSWLVLVPAKCWEGKPGDDSRRRFTMLLLGLVLGLFAWAVAGYLWVELPYDSPIVTSVTGAVGREAYEPNGQPRLLAYLAYFGLLMLVPRWWLQADPQRRRRVNLWSTALCVCYALVLNQFCAFPQPWAMCVAGTMSLAVQLSSGWHRQPRNTLVPRHD
ncbi:MAG TPA: serine/threonine-protein kinase [Pirellulales bacterium]